jgi:xanthine dehydrogenase accessory factor
MREALQALQSWLQQGEPAALATVVRTWGSAPRQPGAKMAVSRKGEMAGSVSGGCVEAAVAEEAARALQDGAARLLEFDVQDETAWGVGLTCGGHLEVLVEPIESAHPEMAALLQAFQRGEPAVRAVVVGGSGAKLGEEAVLYPDGRVVGALDPAVVEALKPGLRAGLASGAAQISSVAGAAGEPEVLLDPVLPPATLVIVGAVHIAMALARLAKVLGYRVAVVDPRRQFATRERFPEVDEIIREWPDQALNGLGLTPTSAVAVLTHDPKLDDPALLAALRTPAGYVGALGSRRTHALRRSRLLEAGLTEHELARLHAPIGLDLGRGVPEEIALSILAEIVAVRAGKLAGPSG